MLFQTYAFHSKHDIHITIMTRISLITRFIYRVEIEGRNDPCKDLVTQLNML